VTTYVLSVFSFLWILILIWTDTLVKLQFGDFTFFGNQYWASTQIVSIIALAYIFHAIYLLQLPGVYLLERSGLIAWIRGLGAVSNIILNLLFIPEYGIVGAACATCISFILMAFMIFLVNRRIFVIHYEWKKIFIIFVSTLSYYFLFNNFDLSFMQKILMSLSFPMISICCGVFRIRDFNSLLID